MLPYPWIILGLLLAFLGTNGLTGFVAYEKGVAHERTIETASSLTAEKAARSTEHKVQTIVNDAGVKDVAAKTAIATNIKTVKEYIYVHVPQSDDRTCRMPLVLERVYDASGTGNTDYLASNGGESDSASENIPCDEAARIFTENNEAFRANAQQLIDLTAAYDSLRSAVNASENSHE